MKVFKIFSFFLICFTALFSFLSITIYKVGFSSETHFGFAVFNISQLSDSFGGEFITNSSKLDYIIPISAIIIMLNSILSLIICSIGLFKPKSNATYTFGLIFQLFALIFLFIFTVYIFVNINDENSYSYYKTPSLDLTSNFTLYWSIFTILLGLVSITMFVLNHAINNNSKIKTKTKAKSKSKQTEGAAPEEENNEFNMPLNFTSSPATESVSVHEKIDNLRQNLSVVDMANLAHLEELSQAIKVDETINDNDLAQNIEEHLTENTEQIRTKIKTEEKKLKRELDELNNLKELRKNNKVAENHQEQTMVKDPSVLHNEQLKDPSALHNEQLKDPYKETIFSRRVGSPKINQNKPLLDDRYNGDNQKKAQKAYYDESYQGKIFVGDGDVIFNAMKNQRLDLENNIKKEQTNKPTVEIKKDNYTNEVIKQSFQNNTKPTNNNTTSTNEVDVNPTIDWGD